MQTGTNLAFVKDVNAFIHKAPSELEKDYRVRVFEVFNDVFDGTPRDRGTLKNNWQLGTQLTRLKKPVGDYALGEDTGTRTQALNNSQRVQLHETTFIFNNTEYALAVEKGLGPGRRVPRRMVEKAVELAKARSSFR